MAHMHVNWSIYISPYWKCCLSLATGWPDFRCAYRRAVKNWKRRQIFYPCAALRRPLKHCLFMYNRETFKIIGFSLSILFFFFFSLLHPHIHTYMHSSALWGKSQVIIMQSFRWLESLEPCTTEQGNFSGVSSPPLNQCRLLMIAEWIMENSFRKGCEWTCKGMMERINEIVAFKNFTYRGHESALLVVYGALKVLCWGTIDIPFTVFHLFFSILCTDLYFFTNILARQQDLRLQSYILPDPS